MEIRRFFVTPDAVSGENIIISNAEYTHITKVLRYKVGYKMIVCDNSGNDYFCTITQIDKSSVTAKIDGVEKNPNCTKKKVRLFQCITRSDRFDLILQKAVELGVSEIIPVRSQYSTEKEINGERAERIVLEACKQCGLAVLPKVGKTMDFKDAVTTAKGGVLAYEREDKSLLTEKTLEGLEEINIFVGSEGGFAESEVGFARENGIKTVSLGKRILRTETASIVFTSLVMFLSGEMSL